MPVNTELEGLLGQYTDQIKAMGVPVPAGLGATEDQIHSQLEPIFGEDVPDDYLTWFLWSSTLGIDEGIVPAELIPYMMVGTTTTSLSTRNMIYQMWVTDGPYDEFPEAMKRWIGLNSGNDILTLARHEEPLVPVGGRDGCYRVCNDWSLHRYRPEENFYLVDTRPGKKRPDAEIPTVSLTHWVSALVDAAPTFHYEELAPAIHHVLPKEPSHDWEWAVPLTAIG